MTVDQCWTKYLNADAYLQQGFWLQAHPLLSEVLNDLPAHIYQAMESHSIKPCQLECLLDGYRQATVSQSEIMNQLGQHNDAFTLLNQTYSYLQSLATKSTVQSQTVVNELHQHIDALFRYMGAFCDAQPGEVWTQEFQNIQKSHQFFYQP